MADNSKVVYAAIAAGAAITVTKFVAAGLSGSASLLAEALHSVADTGNDCMVLLGKKRSHKALDATHPFGHGKELYFWTLVVAGSLLTLGGVGSIGEGVLHIVHPEPLENPAWNYAALALAALFEGYSWVVSWRQLMAEKDDDESAWAGIKHAKDPTTFLVVFEDSAALAGVLIAFLGVFLAHRLHQPWLDGLGAVGVGLVLVASSLLLVNEIRKLLVGERADPDLLEWARALAERDGAVARAEPPRSMHFGPETVLLAVRAEFQPGLSGPEVADAIARLHGAIQREHPEVRYVYIEPQPPGGAATARRAPESAWGPEGAGG